MRLTAIKLSGFKSFVDSTVIKFPSNLMGIVGPNGCGKSNIIDAVRWVMGESSARQLRGESMSDVIFSGSSARKPVGTATVELVFDNADGRAGGEYAAYSEISVKRQVSRDGQSSYFLNGSRCRRKDITDLFLGTGLGPRSYAIIEQGMISQIVEARPEELRGFLEEAAGISRYKERRRETENRIRHTRDNLERLSDLREEVGKQLAKLKRQANAAERYRKLKARYREDEARLMALKWRELRARAEAEERALREVENRLQAALARQREAEKHLESLRQSQHQASERAAGIQGELYEVTGEIARLEQAIEHQREIRQRQQKEHAETEAQLNELKQHLVLDKAQVDETTRSLASLEPKLAEAREAETGAVSAVETAEQALADWQQRWEAHQSSASEAGSRAALLKQRIEHLDDRMSRASERLAALDKTSGQGALEQLETEQESSQSELAGLEREVGEAQEQSDTGRGSIENHRRQIESLRDELEGVRADRNECLARAESLRVLNRPDKRSESAGRWLKRAGCEDAEVLLKRLELRDKRWTTAVETVLSGWLDAFVIDKLGRITAGGKLPAGLSAVGDLAVEPRPETLAELVNGAGALTAWLNQVQLAPDLATALESVERLEPGQSMITPDGEWLGPGWLRVAGAEADEAGKLEREGEIRDCDGRAAELAARITELEGRLADGREALAVAEQEQQQTAARLDELRRKRAQVQGQLSALGNRLQALKRQQQSASEEAERLRQRQAQDREAVGQARSELETVMSVMAENEAEREPLRQEQQRLQASRAEARDRQREATSHRESVALQLESGRAGLDSLKQSIARMDNQIGQLQARFIELSQALAQGDGPVREQQRNRDRLLEKRLEIDKRLREARSEVERLEAEWRERDEARQSAAAEAEEVRQQQSDRQMAVKESQLRAETLAGRVEELGASLEELLAELPEGSQTQAFQEQLEKLEEKIRRLEPVNLAAIEEYQTESERKEYLDRQHTDLEEALATLEKAINRIDRDTRTRYRETFERVNKNMENLFPRLFGGGHAYLEMVGEDWLTAGVAIMARPPGKRISRIHLMSGGEKALTAVSLVFSIFNLNPAPFCLLDEVDAPLDDANVSRFSDMVREMSERVQFVIVTHNKVTMEVCHQMLGVTMREAGVSRLVTVDLDKAVELASASA